MMLCPTCARPLHAVERQGIEIEHCQQCGGLWLDAGKLDHLVRQEAQLALNAGQQALSMARNNREYDAAMDETTAVVATAGEGYAAASSVLRRAAGSVSRTAATPRPERRARIVV